MPRSFGRSEAARFCPPARVATHLQAVSDVPNVRNVTCESVSKVPNVPEGVCSIAVKRRKGVEGKRGTARGRVSR